MTGNDRALRPILIVAAIYAVTGITTAALAKSALSPHMVTVWRMTAWLLSLVVFIGHVAYEHLRMRSGVKGAAVHAATAVALATFVLAILGPVRSHWGDSNFWRTAALSVPLWPLLTGVASFIIALIGGSLLARVTRAT